MNKHAKFQPYKPRPVGSTKAVITELVSQSGGREEAADILERSVTQVASYTDPETKDQISYDQVRRLIRATKSTIPAEDLALLAGGIFLPMGSSDDCFHTLTAQSALDYGRLTSAILEASADGKITHPEMRTILPKLDDLIRCLVHARAKLVHDGVTE